MYISKETKLILEKTCDIIIPTILIGQVIGRWGNYANYEVYGRIDYSGASSLIFGKAFAENMFLKDENGTGYRIPTILVWVNN